MMEKDQLRKAVTEFIETRLAPLHLSPGEIRALSEAFGPFLNFAAIRRTQSDGRPIPDTDPRYHSMIEAAMDAFVGAVVNVTHVAKAQSSPVNP